MKRFYRSILVATTLFLSSVALSSSSFSSEHISCEEEIPELSKQFFRDQRILDAELDILKITGFMTHTPYVTCFSYGTSFLDFLVKAYPLSTLDENFINSHLATLQLNQALRFTSLVTESVFSLAYYYTEEPLFLLGTASCMALRVFFIP